MATFSAAAAQTNNQRIVLTELDISVDDVSLMLPFEAGIYCWTMTQSETVVAASYWYTVFAADTEVDGTDYNIQSLRVNNQVYTKVSSLADLRTTNSSFYYNNTLNILYIHFENGSKPWWMYTISPGGVWGFTDQGRKDEIDGCYWGNVYYEPRITSELSLKQTKDPDFYGIMAFDSITIEHDNADGFFDTFPNMNLFGQPYRVKVGYTNVDYDDFETVYSGFVEGPSFPDLSTMQLSVMDQRKALSRSLPTRTVTSTAYTNLNEDDENKPKPLAWGAVRNAPCICLNKDETTPASYTYLFLDTTDHAAGALTQVYAGGVAVAHGGESLANGTFTLTTTLADDGKAEVTADFTGFDGITNGLDVIKDILTEYADVTYSATTYDTTEWAAEQTDAANIGLWLGQGNEKKISEVIELIGTSLDGSFLVLGDGRYTFRSWDSSRASVYTILQDEILGEPAIEYPPDEYLSSVVVLYSPDNNGGDSLRVENTDYETAAANTYKRYEQKEYETVLTSSSDADDLAEAIITRRKAIVPTVKLSLALYPDFEIMQFVTATILRNSGTTIIPESVYEVVEIDPLKFEVSLKWVEYT